MEKYIEGLNLLIERDLKEDFLTVSEFDTIIDLRDDLIDELEGEK
jgi:hypothetical protein